MSSRWVIAVACGLAVLLLVLLVAGSDDPAAAGLELVGIILSWPAVVGGLLVAFGIVFRSELSQFLANISRVRFPGGTEIERQPAPSDIDEANIPEDEIQAPEAEPDNKAQALLLDIAIRSHRESLYWFFMYLSIYLVPTTKEVLAWTASFPNGVTKEFLEATWTPRIPQPIERAATLNALLQTEVIGESGGLLRVTDRGRRFLLFMAGDLDAAIDGGN